MWNKKIIYEIIDGLYAFVENGNGRQPTLTGPCSGHMEGEKTNLHWKAFAHIRRTLHDGNIFGNFFSE